MPEGIQNSDLEFKALQPLPAHTGNQIQILPNIHITKYPYSTKSILPDILILANNDPIVYRE
jgi:hypothetical protein